MKIDGKELAKKITEELKKSFDLIPKKKILAAVYAGENPASESFIRIKEKKAKELGVDFRVYKFEEDISNEKLREEVAKIGKQGVVGGLIVQLPLPQKINRQRILNAISEEKDIDCLTEKNLGKLASGREGVLPPAVETIKEIIKNEEVGSRFRGNDIGVAVVGAGFLVGKPAAAWFSGKVKEVAVFNEGSDLEKLKKYDLVISGVGKRGIIKPEFLKEGAGVIDFGFDEGCGDLDISDKGKLEKLSFWTPTPGGTGPILVVKLFENFLKLV